MQLIINQDIGSIRKVDLLLGNVTNNVLVRVEMGLIQMKVQIRLLCSMKWMSNLSKIWQVVDKRHQMKVNHLRLSVRDTNSATRSCRTGLVPVRTGRQAAAALSILPGPLGAQDDLGRAAAAVVQVVERADARGER